MYGSSLFTITAAGAASCKVGFIGTQLYGSLGFQQSVWLETPPEYRGPLAKTYLRPSGQVTHTESSLDKSGWCLQESVLPNRRLIAFIAAVAPLFLKKTSKTSYLRSTFFFKARKVREPPALSLLPFPVQQAASAALGLLGYYRLLNLRVLVVLLSMHLVENLKPC